MNCKDVIDKSYTISFRPQQGLTIMNNSVVNGTLKDARFRPQQGLTIMN